MWPDRVSNPGPPTYESFGKGTFNFINSFMTRYPFWEFMHTLQIQCRHPPPPRMLT